MTASVSNLKESGIIEKMFSGLDQNPIIGYLAGASVAFILQSSSATIGILQAFSSSGQLTFGGIYAVLVGIYLGDCVTTAIVCNIGAKPDAKRVGVVNILFNLSETVLIVIAVNVLHKFGLLDFIWKSTIRSGGIANTNTIFNLSCAILLLPMVGVYDKISHRLVKDENIQEEQLPRIDKLAALNPVFFSTPALAFNACYEVLLEMFDLARENIMKAFELISDFQEGGWEKIDRNEKSIDLMADRVNNYLIQISAHITAQNHIEIMNHYYTAIGEFEHLGDKAINIAEIAQEKGAIYVDLYSHLVGDDGYVQDRYTEDGLHISEAAYEVWADIIRPYIY